MPIAFPLEKLRQSVGRLNMRLGKLLCRAAIDLAPIESRNVDDRLAKSTIEIPTIEQFAALRQTRRWERGHRIDCGTRSPRKYANHSALRPCRFAWGIPRRTQRKSTRSEI